MYDTPLTIERVLTQLAAAPPRLEELTAGARALIVTLWPVDDVSTVFLMWRFYRNCVNGRSIAAALGEAQTWLRDLRPTEALNVLTIWSGMPR